MGEQKVVINEVKEQLKGMKEQTALSSMRVLAERLESGTLTDEDAGILIVCAIQTGLWCEDYLEKAGAVNKPTDSKRKIIMREFCKTIMSIFASTATSIIMAKQNEKLIAEGAIPEDIPELNIVSEPVDENNCSG